MTAQATPFNSKRRPCDNANGTRKRGYDSKRAAEQAAQRLNRDYRNDQPAYPYMCPGCRQFHVGHAGLWR